MDQLLYDQMDQHVLTVLTTETSFPASTASVVANPEAIFVQSISLNIASIFIGKTGVKSDYSVGAFELAPGTSCVLAYNLDENLKAISGKSGQKLFVTYLSGVN